jgi:hypothetical protein
MAMVMVSPAMLCAGQFKPYEIHAGASYYSNEYTSNNGIAELGDEKNIEEVYQNYNYYEAVFDDQERIVIFKAYEKGAIEFSETYSYDESGHQAHKVVKDSEGTIVIEETIRVESTDTP